MSECANCGGEISAKAKYCSDKCRMAFKRAMSRVGQQSLTRTEPEQSVRLDAQPEQILTPEQIDDLPLGVARPTWPEPAEPKWKSTKGYAMLIYDLVTKPLDQLKAEGYWVPCWKYAEVA